jgi:hypothetical protein
MRCKECGLENPCVNEVNDLCKECDENFIYCYTQCKYPCRTKEEQEKLFGRINPDWNVSLKL